MNTASAPEPLSAERVPEQKTRLRTRLIQVYLALATLSFALLLGFASIVPYFSFDLVITRAAQSYHGPWYAVLMRAVSWPGFEPQIEVLTGLICLALFALHLRLEAACALFAALSAAALGIVVKISVHRPRPLPDLVSVVEQLDSYSFPSGHVLFYTVFFGYLFIVMLSRFKPSLWRLLLLLLLGGLIALVGLSRITLGQHWFSDALAAYLLGSVWLSVVLRLYRWALKRFPASSR
jgi:undecaprenyl-diphosphatase